MRLYDYELLYKQNMEPISILTDEELSGLSDEQNNILMYDELKLFPPEYADEGEKWRLLPFWYAVDDRW